MNWKLEIQSFPKVWGFGGLAHIGVIQTWPPKNSSPFMNYCSEPTLCFFFFRPTTFLNFYYPSTCKSPKINPSQWKTQLNCHPQLQPPHQHFCHFLLCNSMNVQTFKVLYLIAQAATTPLQPPNTPPPTMVHPVAIGLSNIIVLKRRSPFNSSFHPTP